MKHSIFRLRAQFLKNSGGQSTLGAQPAGIAVLFGAEDEEGEQKAKEEQTSLKKSNNPNTGGWENIHLYRDYQTRGQIIRILALLLRLRHAFSPSDRLVRTYFRFSCALRLAFTATFDATSPDLQAPPSIQ